MRSTVPPTLQKAYTITPWLLAALLYAPVFRQLYQSVWASRDYTHAYFILPVALLLLVLNRRPVRHAYRNYLMNRQVRADLLAQGLTPPPLPFFKSPSAGIPLLMLGLLLFLLGWRQDYIFITTLSLVPFLAGLVLFLFNLRMLKALCFPILYLLLLVPIPTGILDSITIPMRYAATVATVAILKMFQYPITREGLLINIGGHEVYMGAPCSGFRSLITMLSLGLAYLYLDPGRPAKKVILGLAIIPLALFGNLVRTVTICLLTFYFGEEVAQGFFHNFSGLVIFLIMIFGLLILEKGVSSLYPTKKEEKGS